MDVEHRQRRGTPWPTQEIALRQLQTLLEAQTRLRQVAEEQSKEVRRELERLAEAVCPEEVDRLRRSSPEGLTSLPPLSIAELVLAAIRSRLQPPVAAENDLRRSCSEAKTRLVDLKRRLRAAEERARRAEAEVALLKQRLRVAEETAAISESNPLQARHGPGRAGLIEAATDLLAAAGYTVDPLPDPLLLPGGGAFLPDLTLRLEGRLLPVEVEDLSRQAQEREVRWEAGYTLSGGHLCFVAPTVRALDELRSEVLYWAETRPLLLWMTDLERGCGHTGEQVWLVQRGRR